MTSHLTLGSCRRWCALALALAFMAGAAPAGAGVSVKVSPATLTVAQGAQFDLDLAVSPAGSNFNGFDVTVSYDPAALTLVPLAPTSLQQGCLMTGTCSIACGNTFHHFAAAGDSAAISDVLLCNLVSLTGPGQVYKLRFTASNTDQITQVRIRRATFYNAGLFVNPVTTADATITIGSTVGVGPASSPAALRLAAEPNPARGSLVFALEADAAGEQRLVIHDLAGRLVRVVEQGWRAEGSRRVAWDGRDSAGVQVPAGIYLATFGAGDRSARIRVAMVR